MDKWELSCLAGSSSHCKFTDKPPPRICLSFSKCPICLIRNATMASRHKAAFQALRDDLIKHCCHTLVKTPCLTEKTDFFLSTVLFIFYIKSATTLIFEFVWNSELDNDTRLLVAPFLVKCIVQFSMLPLLGKVPFTLWRGLKQWGRFHELYSVVSLTLGKRSQL